MVSGLSSAGSCCGQRIESATVLAARDPYTLHIIVPPSDTPRLPTNTASHPIDTCNASTLHPLNIGSIFSVFFLIIPETYRQYPQNTGKRGGEKNKDFFCCWLHT